MDLQPRSTFISLFLFALSVVIAANVEGLAALYGLDRVLPGNWGRIVMWANYLSDQVWFIWAFGFITAPALYFIAGPGVRRLLNQPELSRLIDREVRANALRFQAVAIFKLIPYEASPATIYLHMTLRNIANAPIYFRIEHASCSLQGKINDQAALLSTPTFLPAGEDILINIPPIPDVPLRENMTGRLTAKLSFGFGREQLDQTMEIDGDIEIAIRRDTAGTIHQSFVLYPRVST